METDNTIGNFSAKDIERYHKGLMSATEMHMLEKAAMDDPFLADALDGYTVKNVDAAGDLQDLKNRLAKRTGGAIAMHSKPAYSWMRIAALFVVLAGAGVLAFTLLNNKQETQLAKFENKQDKQQASSDINDTLKNITGSVKFDSLSNSSVTLNAGTQTFQVLPDSSAAGKSNAGFFANIDTGKLDNVLAGRTEGVNVTSNNAVPSSGNVISPQISVASDDKLKQNADRELVVFDNRQKSKAKEELLERDAIAGRKDFGVNDKNADFKLSPGFIGNSDYKFSPGLGDTMNFRNLNLFRGQVTDVQNNAIPFANVNISSVNIGAYTDANGYFSLVAPDSVLSIQLRAVGYNNSNIQLTNSKPTTQVILQEDNSVKAVVMNSKKPNTTRSRTANITVTEPEPDDGWEKYDSYLVNNIKIPEDIIQPEKRNGEVEVSFEVNNKGEPVNIKVTKSLCKECDEEAVRLIKEGPKWKKKGKKAKAKVMVPF